jgi:radical SAM protein with 4Fe4S-binding SPASM domain
MYAAIADEAVIEEPMNWNGHDNRNLILGYLPSGVDAGYCGRLLSAYNGARYEKVVCPFPFYTLVINANGDATVCCVDWNKKTLIGNVVDSSIEAIWSSRKMLEFRRMHVEGRRHENESCRNCTYLSSTPDNLDDLSPNAYASILR